MTIETLKDAVQDFYSDTSRPREDTKAGLEEVRDEIETLIESLED